MYTYKSEVLSTTFKWIKDSANEKDVQMLDELINKRASEGWEFICHSFMANVASGRSAILVTFRKEKKRGVLFMKKVNILFIVLVFGLMLSSCTKT